MSAGIAVISLIAAMTKNRVIGSQGQMPWHLPAELAYFKKITLGKPILMGRKTYDSIGRPLPNRRNFVLSRQPDLVIPGCEIVRSLENVLATIDPSEELMIIGGSSLFEQTIDLADRMYLTFIECELSGDSYFPDWNSLEWKEVSSEFHPQDHRNQYAFHCVEFNRKPST